jgi:pilus assembly protein FimV
MSFDHRISAAAVLAAASLAWSPAAWSLGLGDAAVESFLNQPLQVRIDLISQPSDDLTTLSARLASAADYEMIGASLEAVPVPIRFSIEDTDGDAYILGSSDLPINNPVVRLIVEVNWSSGRMLREYTLFLDPATVAEPAPAPRVDQRTAVPAPPPARASEEPGTEPQPQPARPVSRVPSAQEYGPVQSGDTLWEIASDWSSGSGLGINRVMIAIQRENPAAFARGNINLLKRGAILRMPTVEQVESVSSSAANREVVAQQEQFVARRASPAAPLPVEESLPPAAVEETAPAPAYPVESEASDEAAAEPEAADAAAEQPGEVQPVDEAVAIEEAPMDVLELVPPSADAELASAEDLGGAADAGEADASAQQLRENLARTEEELINQQQQNEYLEERIRELESRLKTSEEGTAADADLANMETRLREQREAAATGEDKPWYKRLLIWFIGLLVLAAGVVGWLFSRRGQPGEFEGAATVSAEPLREIQSDAEEVLRTLTQESPEETGGEPETPEEPAAAIEAKVVRFPSGEGDAKLLDEESSDPEIQLDLARAYISMGDREAARVILDEVLSNGSERQQADARKMLDLLDSP